MQADRKMIMKTLYSKLTLHHFLQFLGAIWFYIAITLVIVLAAYFPDFAKPHGTIHSEYSVHYGAIALLFFTTGLSVSTHSVQEYLLRWRIHLVVLMLTFPITSLIVYVLCCCIYAAQNPKLDNWMLVGLVMTATCPPTVSSNVVLTRKAGGNDVLVVTELIIMNLIGVVLSPALLQLYTSGGPLQFGNPGNLMPVKKIYAEAIKRFALAVLLPTLMGQAIQYAFPKQVEWAVRKFRLNVVGSLCLLMLMFASFSDGFAQHTFDKLAKESFAFLILFNAAIILVYLLLCFTSARFFFFGRMKPPTRSSGLYYWFYRLFKPFYCNRRDTVAIMYCASSKTMVLGVLLFTSQYGTNFEHGGIMLSSLLFFQVEQIVVSSLLSGFWKRWIETGDRDGSSDDHHLDRTSNIHTAEYESDENDGHVYVDDSISSVFFYKQHRSSIHSTHQDV